MPSQFRELKPYRSLLLAKVVSSAPVTPIVDRILDDVRGIVDDAQSMAFGSRRDASDQGGLQAGFLHYVETKPPGWSDGSVSDTLNQIVVVCRLGRLVAVYASDNRFRAILKAGFGDSARPGLEPLRVLPRGRLNAAFVRGVTRTLWLSGTHRRTTVKADSKILGGLNLRDSLDPLDDQTYYFSAARSVPPLLGAPIGVAPRKSAVWAGSSRDWDEFIGGVRSILDVLDSTTESLEQPLPVVATQTSDLSHVDGAFDVTFVAPELSADPNVAADQRENLERWAFRSAFEVTDPGPPVRTTISLDGTLLGTVDFALDLSNAERVTWTATGEPDGPAVAELHAEAVQFARSNRRVKIRFDSGHTLSDGAVFEQRHRDLPFTEFRFVDFEGFDVKKEKPTPVTAVGEGQDSLFDWTFRFWPNLDGTQNLPGGFLVSDDGSMEIADFVHLDRTEAIPVVSLIHVKAAGSASPNRGISVSSYEVVTGQAVKNLRFFDRLVLAEGLAAGLGSAISPVAFFNRQPSTRQALIDALEDLGSNFRRRLVIVQPHVRRTRLEAARADPSSADAARLRQLDTLLLGAESDAHALGADFLVVTAV